MDIPFTRDQFFEIFVRYNQSVWPMQIALNVLAFLSISLLFIDRVSAGRGISIVLVFLWAWMAVSYHFVFFTSINPAAWAFGALFLAAALWFAWLGVIRGRLQYRVVGGIRGVFGAILLAFALIMYPLLGFVVGHRYPAIPTFGLPCPTTIYTIGILLFVIPPLPRSVFIIPLLWSAIGSVAAFQLGVFQDLGLLAAGIIGLTMIILAPRQVNHSSLLTR